MRRIFTLLTMIASGLAFSQPVGTGIKEIRELSGAGAGSLIFGSHIIDTRSSLSIELDLEQIYASSLSPERKAALSAKIHRINTLLAIAKEGQLAVSESLARVASVTPEQLGTAKIGQILGPASKVVSQVISALTGPEFVDVKTRITQAMRAIKGPNALLQQASAAFIVLQDYAKEQASALSQEGVEVRVQLKHLRENDSTRRREIKVLEPLSDADKVTLNQLKKLYPSSTMTSPTALVNVLVASIKEQGKKALESVLESVSKKIDEKKDALDLLQKQVTDAWSGASDVKTKIVTDLNEWLDSARHMEGQIKAVRDKVVAINVGDGLSSLQTNLSLLTVDISALARNIERVGVSGMDLRKKILDQVTNSQIAAERTIQATVKGLDGFFVSLEAELKNIGQQVVEAASLLTGHVLEQLNFAAQMTEIGRAFTDVKENPVVLVNDDGRIGDLKAPLVSGDELLLNVQVQGTEEKELPAIRLFAYKIGWRTDRLIAASFFNRTDGKSFRLGASVTDVFKLGSRRSLDSNRLLSIGIGPSLAILDQDGDDQIESGIGLGISILDDRLIGGMGYNLSLNRSYYFVGFRFAIRM